jgi:hypothetical protein
LRITATIPRPITIAQGAIKPWTRIAGNQTSHLKLLEAVLHALDVAEEVRQVLEEVHPGDAPGLGVSVQEDVAGRFPYQRAYLPVARTFDGALKDW